MTEDPATWHLAQLNIGRLVAPEGDPRVADFFAALDRINALADAAPGFVWRLVDEDGKDATGLRPWGDGILVNLSTWRSVEALRTYVFRSAHLDLLRRRREWFLPFGDVHEVSWWVPAGHRPSIDEARKRLDLLREHGSTAEAFRLREPHPAPAAR